MSNSQSKLLKRHRGIQCPVCFMIGHHNGFMHIFDSFKGLSSHISKTHTISHLEIAKIKEISKKYDSGSFLKLCKKEGIIY